MQASRARWALVILSMLGLTGCQSGKSWWPSRNKTPPYSSSSKTPPAGISQNQLPSAQQSPFGAETQPDASQYAQQTGGYAGNPADPYGANNYMGSGADGYANPAAGVTPQNGPYNADAYQQAAGGSGGYAPGGYGTGGYGGAANGNYAGGQVTNPYVGGAAGGQGYNDYQNQQQQGGYATQQTAGGYNPAGYQGAATDPAASQAPYTADARSNYAQPQANYNTPSQYAGNGGAGYGANAAMPEQSPYGAPADPAYGQGGAAGNNGYQPGNTGYNPPGVPPYQSPGSNYNPDPNAGASEPHYRPGGTSDYSPASGTGGASAAGSGAAGYEDSRYGNSGYGTSGAANGGYANGGAANSGYNDAGAASTARYPNSTPTGGYPNSGGADRYAQPSSSTAGSGAYENYMPQR